MTTTSEVQKMKRQKSKNYEVYSLQAGGHKYVDMVLRIQVSEAVFNHFIDGKNPTRTSAAKALLCELESAVQERLTGLEAGVVSQAQADKSGEKKVDLGAPVL
jgi:hypothetical protein